MEEAYPRPRGGARCVRVPDGSPTFLGLSPPARGSRRGCNP